MKKKISTLFFVLISVIVSLMLVNAVQDFSVTPSSLTDTVTVGSSGSETFTIENTGSEVINLTLSDDDLSRSGETDVSVVLNTTTVTNLAVGATLTVQASYSPNSNQATGAYTSTITVENSDNSSQSETVSLSVTLQSDSSSNNNIEFVGEGSTLDMELDVDDDTESQTFKLKNIGSQRIDDIEIELERLDGDDDEIDNDEIEINGEPGDETYVFDDEEGSDFHLLPDEETNVRLRIDIPSNLDVDVYRGDLKVSYVLNNGTSESRTFLVRVDANSDDEDVYFDDNLYVRNQELEIQGEAGDLIDDIELDIQNDASFDVEDLTLVLDGVFEEEDSSETMPASVLTFNSIPFTVGEDETESIDLEVDIPENQATGTYIADLELRNSDGRKKDEIKITIEVTGEVYLKELNFPEEIEPGENFDLEFTLKNQGSSSLRAVQVYATLFDIDFGNSDITESTSTFILEADGEKTDILRFNIPEEASDGSKTLQIRITYDGEEISEVESIRVNRPTSNIVVDSFGINPKVVRCQNEVFSFISFENLGKFDEDVQVIVEIEGTNVRETSSEFELEVDGQDTQNMILDIKALEPGDYTVTQKINAGGRVTTKTSALQILECSETTVGGIDIEDTSTNETADNLTTNTVEIFGQEIETTTAWLGGGVGVVFLAIVVVAIFLL